MKKPRLIRILMIRPTGFLGRLSRAEVTKEAPGQAAQTRVSSFEYDVNTGLLNKEVIEPDHLTLKLEKGLTHMMGMENILTSTTTGPNIVASTLTSVYDNRGQFSISNTNELNHSESKTYDVRHGKVASSTGTNALITSWDYDAWGRVVHEYRADGTESRTLNLLVDAQNPGPANAKYLVRTDSSGSVPSFVYYDILDREIRRETLGLNGQKIFVDTEYNDRGEVVKISDPYFEGDTPVWTENVYDDLGRVTQITAPGSRISTTTYNGFTTTVTNPKNQTNTRIVNSLDQMIESKDNLNNSILYTYDSFGNLVELEDPDGNITTMQYDVRGNKVQMDDPDSGVTTYVYNALGQLISQTNAKNQTVTFVYDELGRMTSRTEVEGLTTWVYDTQLKASAN